MPNEFPESPYRPPAEANQSNPRTPDALSMGSAVVAALAAIGACTVTCFGASMLIRREEDLGLALLVLIVVGLATFVTVVIIHSRWTRNVMRNSDKRTTPEPNTKQADDRDDTGQ